MWKKRLDASVKKSRGFGKLQTDGSYKGNMILVYFLVLVDLHIASNY